MLENDVAGQDSIVNGVEVDFYVLGALVSKGIPSNHRGRRIVGEQPRHGRGAFKVKPYFIQ